MIEANAAPLDALKSADNLIAARDHGTPLWWARIAARGTPLIQRTDEGAIRVTFLYRDGSHDTARVYIDVNGVTDHHSPSPRSLQRIAGTDIWYWQVDLPSQWRGSYSFMPATDVDGPPMADDDVSASRLRHRAWWSRIAATARPDPLNLLRAYPSGWGGKASALHLPDAPDQSAWRGVDLSNAPSPPASFEWHSAVQGKRRTVWHLRTGDPVQRADGQPTSGLPLILLLDGRNWAERMPVASVLEAQTVQGHLPPALYVFVDSIDGVHRSEDLQPNPAFWSAIHDELLPLTAEIAPIATDSRHRLVAGQSFGGLAALYAALAYPADWGGALAQSPSLWWPDDSLPRGRVRVPGAAGELTRRLRAGAFPPGPRRVFMEVGTREEVMIDVARTMRDALEAAGHENAYREYEGGHDSLCWRGGLIDGLRWLLAPSPASTRNLETPA